MGPENERQTPSGREMESQRSEKAPGWRSVGEENTPAPSQPLPPIPGTPNNSGVFLGIWVWSPSSFIFLKFIYLFFVF